MRKNKTKQTWYGKAKGKNSILNFERKKNSHGKAKGKSPIPTFEKKKKKL